MAARARSAVAVVGVGDPLELLEMLHDARNGHCLPQVARVSANRCLRAARERQGAAKHGRSTNRADPYPRTASCVHRTSRDHVLALSDNRASVNATLVHSSRRGKTPSRLSTVQY